MRLYRVVAALAFVAAQTPTPGLRFHPRAGSLMRTQADFDVTATYVGLPAVPDSETAVLNMRLIVSRRPTAQLPTGAWAVQLTLDSARATSKFSTAGRKDVALPFDGTGLNLIADSVMAFSPGNEGPIASSQMADTARRGFAKAMSPVFMVPLPAKAVSSGATWTSDESVPLSDLMPPGVPGAVSGPRQVTAHLAAKLDSLVPRGTDTLAYISYTGNYEPVTSTWRDTTGTNTLTVRGGLAASQIWSTSWSGWVSGGIRMRTELKVHTATMDATISADVTGRMQVRP